MESRRNGDLTLDSRRAALDPRHWMHSMTIGILYRDELNEYDFGPGHPFRGDRYNMFMKFLKEHIPEDNKYRIIEAEPASDEDLLFICTQDYIDRVREFYLLDL